MLTAGKIRLLLALTIVASIVWLVVVTLKRMPTSVPSSSTATSGGEKQAELTLRGIRVNETSNGRTRWTLVAERAEYDTNRSLVKLTDVKLSVAPIEKALGELVLTSPSATYNADTRDVFLVGGVRAHNRNGMSFSSRSVRFIGRVGVVTTADAVKFSDEGLMLEGTGMEYMVESSALKISSDVTATLKGGNR